MNTSPIRSRVLVWLLLCVVSASLLAAGEVAPANEGPLRYEELFRLPRLAEGGGLAVSADGGSIAYIQCAPDGDSAGDVAGIPDNKCSLWVRPTRGSNHPAVQVHAEGASNPAWSADSRYLAFFVTSPRSKTLRVWDRERSSEPSRPVGITNAYDTSSTPVWVPGTHRVLLLIADDADRNERAVHESQPAFSRSSTDASTAVVFTAGNERERDVPPETSPLHVPRIHPLVELDLSSEETRTIGNVSAGAHCIYAPGGERLACLSGAGISHDLRRMVELVLMYPAHAGRTISTLRFAQSQGDAFAWSPDGKHLGVFVDRLGDPERRQDLAILTASGKELFRVPDKDQPGLSTETQVPLWDPTGRFVYFIHREQLWRADIQRRALNVVAANSRQSILALARAPGSRQIWSSPSGLYVMTRNASTLDSGLARVASDGRLLMQSEEHREYHSGFLVGFPGSQRDGSVVFVAESSAAPPEAWRTDLSDRRSVQLTHSNAALTPYAAGESRLVRFTGQNGVQLRASMLLPGNYQTGKRYPLVVWVYGGGMGSEVVNRFGLESPDWLNMQILASRGYAVLFPDLPSSGADMMKDYLSSAVPAIDAAAASGVIDSSRVAVMGHSNGGYAALSLIVQSDRFRAAVICSGPTNLITSWGAMSPAGDMMWSLTVESAMGAVGAGIGAPPWVAPDLYIENSPFFRLDRVTIPVFIQAGADDRGIVESGDELYLGLKRLGRSVTYVRYEQEGHMLNRYSNRVDFWERVLSFLSKHLRDAELDRAP